MIINVSPHVSRTRKYPKCILKSVSSNCKLSTTSKEEYSVFIINLQFIAVNPSEMAIRHTFKLQEIRCNLIVRISDDVPRKIYHRHRFHVVIRDKNGVLHTINCAIRISTKIKRGEIHMMIKVKRFTIAITLLEMRL